MKLFIDTEEINTGSAVYNSGDASSTISTTSSGDAVISQTNQRYNYSSGKGAQILQTIYDLQPVTDVVKMIGYYSFFFYQLVL